MRSHDSPPSAVGRFHLLRLIGVGGMSEVYLGYDPTDGATVAVKVLAAHLTREQQFVNRFYREVRLSQELEHPSLIRGRSSGYDPRTEKHFLAMEYVDGLTAKAVLDAGGPFPLPAAARVVSEVAAALDYLHARKLVHRDVKPENILLTRDGPAKLADLGLAKRLGGDADLTTANQGIGTPSYMPHEQARNAALVDARSDVFALGATLYHLLTGSVPSANADAFPAHPNVPPAVEPVLRRMLARNPADRFPTATAATLALDAPEREGGYAAFLDRSRPTDARPTPDALTRLDPVPVARSGRWGAALTLLLAAGVAAGGALSVVGSAFDRPVAKSRTPPTAPCCQ